MAINTEAFNYIKENFITQIQVDDYVINLKEITNNATSNAISPGAALNKLNTFMVGPDGTSGVWLDVKMPIGAYIIPADLSDEAWTNAAIRAIKKQNTKNRGENPTSEIIKILKKFDDKIPTQNVDLTDPIFAKAFKGWFNGSYGKNSSCWSSSDSAVIMISFAAERIKSFKIGSEDVSPENPEDLQEPPANEEGDLGFDIERQAALETFLMHGAAIIGFDHTSTSYSAAGQFYEILVRRNNADFVSDRALQDNYIRQFISIASPTVDIAELSNTYQIALFQKIEASGLYDLLSSVDAIQAFGRARLQTLDRVKGSAGAAGVLDGIRDTVWLQQLTAVLQRLSRDPVTLATIYRYFPELVNFFFTALAVSSDYSNDGAGRRCRR